MKCVKMFDGDYKDRVVRVPDSVAEKVVAAGRGEYSGKLAWKKQYEDKSKRESLSRV
jgi:hypothetical protein